MGVSEVGTLFTLYGEVLSGIISERDHARKVILIGRTSKDTRVGEVMSTTLTTVTPEQNASDCMTLMSEKRIRHLPDLGGRKVVGIISIGDVVSAVISNQASMT